MTGTGAPVAEGPHGAQPLRPVRPTRLSLGVSIYLTRQFLGAFLLVFILFVAVILIVDLIELLRRASGKESATFGIVLNMAIYKLPQTVQKTMPFAILFGGMLGFWRLNRTSELIALRASGVSVWHFVLPVVFAAALLAVVKVSLINPLGTILIGRYEQLENRHLKGRSPLMAATTSGVWLRQSVDDGLAVIHAKGSSVQRDTLVLKNVMVLLYGPNDRFDGRIDSANAVLRERAWRMENAWVSVRGEPPERKAVYTIPTTLTLESIQESFSSPSSISFWELPRFVDSLEALGFSAQRHRLHWHSLLAEPMLYCAMILIAAVSSLRHNRRTGVLLAVAGGIGAGIVLYFVSDLVLALAHSTGVPPVLAAWAPALATAFLGVTALLHLEDG